MLDVMVDALCRFALDESDWRPPLPRTRASAVVALRRITGALTQTNDSVFIGDSAAHEGPFGEWATLLSDFRSVSSGAPDVRLRGTLHAPENEQDPWSVAFYAVADDGTEISFADIWEGTPEAVELGGQTGMHQPH